MCGRLISRTRMWNHLLGVHGVKLCKGCSKPVRVERLVTHRCPEGKCPECGEPVRQGGLEHQQAHFAACHGASVGGPKLPAHVNRPVGKGKS